MAELSGTRVIKAGQPLALANLWKQLGAMVDTSSNSVAKSFSWTIDGSRRATTPDLTTSLSEGTHNLIYTYQDFLGRSYSLETFVEVLSPPNFAQRMASQSVIIGAIAD